MKGCYLLNFNAKKSSIVHLKMNSLFQMCKMVKTRLKASKVVITITVDVLTLYSLYLIIVV